MLVKNENFQDVDLSQIVDDILNDYKRESEIIITEQEAKTALSQMVFESNLKGNQMFMQNKNYAMPIAHAEFLKIETIEYIWEKLKDNVCSKFDEQTEQDKIAEIVANAVSDLLPYKIIVKPLLKLILFYVLKFCHPVVCKM